MVDARASFVKILMGNSRIWRAGMIAVFAALIEFAAVPGLLYGQGQTRLTLDQVEQLIRVGTPDTVIAREIQGRGLNFVPTRDVLGMLRRMGAGPKTLQAMEKLSHTTSRRRLILQVQVNEVVSRVTDQAIDRVITLFHDRNIYYDEVRRVDDTHILVRNVSTEQSAEFRNTVTGMFGTDWDLTPVPDAPGGYMLTLRPQTIANIQSQTMAESVEAIRRRINAFALTEPLVAPYGREGNEIIVELPGEVDLHRAESLIQTRGYLELRRLAETTAYPSEAAALAAHGGVLPPGTVLVAGRRSGVLLLDRTPIITSRDLRSATALASTENSGSYDVAFKLSTESARRFAAFTGSHVGDSLAVILDGRVVQVAIIREQMHDHGRISGGFSEQQARDLATLLRLGPLPASIRYLESTVSPS